MRPALLLLLLVLAGAIALSVLGRGPFLVTREGQFKIALFLGDPTAVITDPGVEGSGVSTRKRSLTN